MGLADPPGDEEEGGDEEDTMMDVEDPADIIKHLDKDGDGMLSLEEILQEGHEDFDEEDRKPLEKMFKQADEDGDGKMSLAELPAMVEMFNNEQGQEDAEDEQQDL